MIMVEISKLMSTQKQKKEIKVIIANLELLTIKLDGIQNMLQNKESSYYLLCIAFYKLSASSIKADLLIYKNIEVYKSIWCLYC